MALVEDLVLVVKLVNLPPIGGTLRAMSCSRRALSDIMRKLRFIKGNHFMRCLCLSLLSLVTFLLSCTDKDSVRLVTVSGHVETYTNFAEPFADNSGITVSLEDSSQSTVTDVYGYWILHNVPADTQNFVFAKPGFVTTKALRREVFESENDIGTTPMHLTPTHSLSFEANLTAGSPSGFILELACKLPTPASSHFYSARIFVGISPSVSSEPGTYFDTFTVDNSFSQTDSAYYRFGYPIRGLSPLLDTTGTHYYLVAYGSTNASSPPISLVYYYYDYITQNTYFSNISTSPSTLKEIILP